MCIRIALRESELSSLNPHRTKWLLICANRMQGEKASLCEPKEAFKIACFKGNESNGEIRKNQHTHTMCRRGHFVRDAGQIMPVSILSNSGWRWRGEHEAT